MKCLHCLKDRKLIAIEAGYLSLKAVCRKCFGLLEIDDIMLHLRQAWTLHQHLSEEGFLSEALLEKVVTLKGEEGK